MTILTTGAARFIRSAVVRLAIFRANSVVNLDELIYTACLGKFKTVFLNNNYTLEKVVSDREAFNTVFTININDIVMHYAAESNLDRSIDEPINFIETNVKSTFNMLEAPRSSWVFCGGESESTNLEMVTTFCNVLDQLHPYEKRHYGASIIFVLARLVNNVCFAIDPTRISSELGWRPSATVGENLERIVQWNLENEDWWRPLLRRKKVGQRLGKEL